MQAALKAIEESDNPWKFSRFLSATDSGIIIEGHEDEAVARDNNELGVFINDGLMDKAANCKKVVIGEVVWVMATEDIKKDDELVWSYGKQFWLIWQAIKELETAKQKEPKNDELGSNAVKGEIYVSALSGIVLPTVDVGIGRSRITQIGVNNSQSDDNVDIMEGVKIDSKLILQGKCYKRKKENEMVFNETRLPIIGVVRYKRVPLRSQFKIYFLKGEGSNLSVGSYVVYYYVFQELPGESGRFTEVESKTWGEMWNKELLLIKQVRGAQIPQEPQQIGSGRLKDRKNEKVTQLAGLQNGTLR